MKKFKYTQFIETGYSVYVEAENMEQAQEKIENGNYEEDFYEDEEPMVVRNLLQEIDEDDEVVDDREW